MTLAAARAGGHPARVGGLAGLLAAQLDLSSRPPPCCTRGIKPAVLTKTGPLTPEERTEIQRHSAIGAEVLMGISPDLALLAEGVRAHHERWDGAGYPDGLAGKQIPLFGRLLAVVDVYDALTSPRIYRESFYTSDEVMAYIEEHAATQFDPECVRATPDVLRAQAHGLHQFPDLCYF